MGVSGHRHAPAALWCICVCGLRSSVSAYPLPSLLLQLTTWRKNPKVHHRTHNIPPPVPILSQLNPVHTLQASLPKIHSDAILPPTTWSSEWSLSFGLSHENVVLLSLFSHACHMPRPPHSPCYYNNNNSNNNRTMPWSYFVLFFVQYSRSFVILIVNVDVINHLLLFMSSVFTRSPFPDTK
jgi:hypothetical protein